MILAQGWWDMAFMAFSSLFFFAFQLCGVLIARRLLRLESGGAGLLLGSVLGSVMLQWLPIPFSFLMGFTPQSNLCALGAAVLLCVLCLALVRKKEPVPLGLSAFARRKFLWVVLGLWVFFCLLVLRSFRVEDARVFSSQATYGDMSMHLSFITSIARQGDFPPDYSLLPGDLLSYPFLSDSISSSLYVFYRVEPPLGCSCSLAIRWSYLLPMVFAGAQVLFGFYLFAARLLNSAKKAALAWTLFFFNGGFGFVYFLSGAKTFDDLFLGFYQTPTNLTEKGLRWVNVVVDMMLPQRATLFGWAVLFPVLYLLYRGAFEGKSRYFLWAGVLGGLLPMIHTHSFMALALISGVWLLFDLLKRLSREELAAKIGKVLVLLGLPLMSLLCALLRRRNDQGFLLWAACGAAGVFLALLAWCVFLVVRRGGGKALLSTWGVLLLTVCVLALPQLCYWTFRQAGTGGFIRGRFGWVISSGEDGYLWFYLKNIGLAALLALGGLLAAKNRDFGKYAPALAIWFLAELVVFQPNDYDNNKLLYAAWALLCCAGADFLARLLERLRSRGLRAAVLAAALPVCVCSAALTMGREWVAKYELFGEGALALCEYVEEYVPPDAVILTDTRHNNEIASLTGRDIVCGSSSYLYFHGLAYGKNEEAVRCMYRDPEGSAEWFREFGVDYILISDFEVSSYAPDKALFGRLFPVVFDDGCRTLYRYVEPSEKEDAP